ncbi:MAG: type II toxin-antitoxin system RelB/DinJ family antitoxin [Spirochaetales bacterium]|nr:type II toxin-antitoxin system RelB/DinJ family antitoxin [Spirochaetales bacterium]
MSDSCLIKIKVDNDMKKNVSKIYENLGLDLTTAIKIFIKKSIAVGGLPFELRNETNDRWALYENARRYIQNHDIPEMSLEEINDEIKSVRSDRVIR